MPTGSLIKITIANRANTIGGKWRRKTGRQYAGHEEDDTLPGVKPCNTKVAYFKRSEVAKKGTTKFSGARGFCSGRTGLDLRNRSLLRHSDFAGSKNYAAG